MNFTQDVSNLLGRLFRLIRQYLNFGGNHRKALMFAGSRGCHRGVQRQDVGLLGCAYTRVDVEGMREFTRQRVVDSGATLASVLPPGVTAYDIFFYAADLNFKYHGLSFHSEYYFRYLSNFGGSSVPALFDQGLLLQTGYFICPGTLEVAARWSRISGDSGTLGVSDQSADEIAAALIWYIRGNNAKLTLDVTHLNGAPIRDLALNILPGDDGWLFRTQLQMRF